MKGRRDPLTARQRMFVIAFVSNGGVAGQAARAAAGFWRAGHQRSTFLHAGCQDGVSPNAHPPHPGGAITMTVGDTVDVYFPRGGQRELGEVADMQPGSVAVRLRKPEGEVTLIVSTRRLVPNGPNRWRLDL